MSELAELLLLIVAVLPALAGVVAAIPGAWWPEARRSWFSTFACAAAALAAGVVASSPLWRSEGLASSVTTGAWSPAGSPVEILCRLSIDPTRAEFLCVLMLASLAVSIALPGAASLRGRQRQAVVALLGAVSSAGFSILATNLLLKAIALSVAALFPIWLGGDPRSATARDRSGGPSPAETEAPRPVALTLVDAGLLFSLLITATTIGTLEEPSADTNSVTAVLGMQLGDDPSADDRAAVLAVAGWLALGLFAAIAVRLALFPFLGGAVDSRSSPLVHSLCVATSLPAAVALLVTCRPLFELAPGIQRSVLLSAGATVPLSAWRSVIAPGRRRAVRSLLSAAGGAVVCIALFADPLAIPIAALVLAVASIWGASRLLRLTESEPAVPDRVERSSAPPHRRPRWSPAARFAFARDGAAVAPLEAAWRTSTAVLLGTGRHVTAAFLFGIRRLHDFAVAVLHELETGAARFYVVAALLATTILLLVLLLT